MSTKTTDRAENLVRIESYRLKLLSSFPEKVTEAQKIPSTVQVKDSTSNDKKVPFVKGCRL